MRELVNGVRATRKAPAEGLLVYSTLAKFKTWAKFEMKKRQVGVIRKIRKETEKNGRGEVGFLMKKGCKEGMVSLQRAYRELIGSLYESWTIGIERVYKQLIHSIV